MHYKPSFYSFYFVKHNQEVLAKLFDYEEDPEPFKPFIDKSGNFDDDEFINEVIETNFIQYVTKAPSILMIHYEEDGDSVLEYLSITQDNNGVFLNSLEVKTLN